MIRKCFPFLDSLFASEPIHQGGDRRAAYRYAPVNDALQLGWHGEEGLSMIPCHILDISVGGIAVYAEGDPPPTSSLLLRLPDCDPENEAGWVAAEVIRSTIDKKGTKFLLNLRFVDGCPYEFFRLITAGDPKEIRRLDLAPEFDPRYWR
jgi:hypothetical protein